MRTNLSKAYLLKDEAKSVPRILESLFKERTVKVWDKRILECRELINSRPETKELFLLKFYSPEKRVSFGEVRKEIAAMNFQPGGIRDLLMLVLEENLSPGLYIALGYVYEDEAYGKGDSAVRYHPAVRINEKGEISLTFVWVLSFLENEIGFVVKR